MADILISQLPRVTEAGDADLLIIDTFDPSNGGIVTSSIRWSDLYAKIATFPQGFRAPDGTPVTPSFSFVNDTNTGLYRAGDDTIGFSTNGIVRGVISSAGYWGINTLLPQERLHVQDGNITLRAGSTNELLLTAADGGMSVRQTKALPLTLATNDLERLLVTGDGRILIGTDDTDSDSLLRVAGTIQSNNATFEGFGGGLVGIGNQTLSGTKDYIFFNSDGAIGDRNQDFGLPGQVITSRGPNQPWEWGIGGGGGGGGLVIKGAIDVTQPAPADPEEGDFYINNTAGNADASFGTTEFVNINALVVFTENGWLISNTQLGNFVDLTTDQSVSGVKTFTETIVGTITNLDRSITAGQGMHGGGKLNSDVAITLDLGDGLEFDDSDNIVVAAGDDTIIVDAGGVKVDTSTLFSNDGTIAAAVTSFNSRKGAVIPQEGDYNLTDMGDVNTAGSVDGEVLTKVGSNFLFRQSVVPRVLQYQGNIDATTEIAPDDSEVGHFYINTVDGRVLQDESWGALANAEVTDGSMVARAVTGWYIIGTISVNAGVLSITAQDGVVNHGSGVYPVLECDESVVRTVNNQTIDGVKTFLLPINGDLIGDVTGEASDCSRSILAGQGLVGGGKLVSNVQLDVSHDTSLAVVSDQLSVQAGPGLKKGSSGISGPLQIDTNWLDANYVPSGGGVTPGNGKISLTTQIGSGIGITGQDAYANQSGNTEWQISCDNTVVRTTGNYTFSGVINFSQDVTMSQDLEVRDIDARNGDFSGTIEASNWNFNNLSTLS